MWKMAKTRCVKRRDYKKMKNEKNEKYTFFPPVVCEVLSPTIFAMVIL